VHLHAVRRFRQDAAAARDDRIRRKNECARLFPARHDRARFCQRHAFRIGARRFTLEGRLVDCGGNNVVRDNACLRQKRLAPGAFARQNERRMCFT
jgi:hypothetical protein